MAMCGFMVFLFKEGVIYKCLNPPSLTRYMLLESHLLATSQTANALAKNHSCI